MIASISPQDTELYLSGLLRVLLYFLIVNGQKISPDYQVTPHEDRTHNASQTNMEDEYIRIIASIIQTSYQQNISIKEIAEKLGLNRSYLTSLFKKHNGKSIRAYLTDYRIAQACIMLKDRRYSIASIASEVGFNDPLYFSRAFNDMKGCSPREYRSNY